MENDTNILIDYAESEVKDICDEIDSLVFRIHYMKEEVSKLLSCTDDLDLTSLITNINKMEDEEKRLRLDKDIFMYFLNHVKNKEIWFQLQVATENLKKKHLRAQWLENASFFVSDMNDEPNATIAFGYHSY